MSKEPNKKQIKNKIKELQSERKKLPQFSYFGDNNWDKLDEEIDCLKDFISGNKDIDDLESELENREHEEGSNAIMECGLKNAIDFLSGYGG